MASGNSDENRFPQQIVKVVRNMGETHTGMKFRAGIMHVNKNMATIRTGLNSYTGMKVLS